MTKNALFVAFGLLFFIGGYMVATTTVIPTATLLELAIVKIGLGALPLAVGVMMIARPWFAKRI